MTQNSRRYLFCVYYNHYDDSVEGVKLQTSGVLQSRNFALARAKGSQAGALQSISKRFADG